MIKKIKIGNKQIGKGEPCFVIAEAGVNHNGDIELAKKLIDIAKNARADAVKFQTFKAEDVVTKKAKKAKYQEKNIAKRETQQEMLKKLELDYEDFKILKKYCDDKKIIFLSTPHTKNAIDFLDELVPVYKIGSGDLTNLPALRHAAKKEKPMLLGTGMSTLREVREAIEVIRSEGNDSIVALHCTTNYPCPLEEVNLRAMQTMQNELECLVGYSDHTLGITVPVIAASLGAVVIEKHLTLDKNLMGPDHRASLELDEFREMVKKIRDFEEIMGSSEKKPTRSELEIRKLIRKSVVAARDISKGVRITGYMIAVKRPGTGIAPKDIGHLIDRITKKNIRKDELIQWDMLE